MNDYLLKIAMKQLKGLFENDGVKQIICQLKDGEVDADFVKDDDIFIKKSEARKIIINEILEERKKAND
jgi:hypothetical protein